MQKNQQYEMAERRVQSKMSNFKIQVENLDVKESNDGQPLTSTLWSALTRDTNGYDSDDAEDSRDSNKLD